MLTLYGLRENVWLYSHICATCSSRWKKLDSLDRRSRCPRHYKCWPASYLCDFSYDECLSAFFVFFAVCQVSCSFQSRLCCQGIFRNSASSPWYFCTGCKSFNSQVDILCLIKTVAPSLTPEFFLLWFPKAREARGRWRSLEEQY